MESFEDPQKNNMEHRNYRSGYVSMFHLNGRPIIPPLMTSEKRREMRDYKERAVALEKAWIKKHCSLQKESISVSDLETPRVLQTEEPTTSNRSSEFSFATSQKISSETYDSLADMMRSVELDTEETIQKAEDLLSRENKEKNMKKLKQSQTLIYDNILNEIVLPFQKLPNAEFLVRNNCQVEGLSPEQVDLYYKGDNKENIEAHKLFLLKSKPSFSRIPEIFINPPTPMTEKRSVEDLLDSIARQVVESDEENSSYGSCDEVRIVAGNEQATPIKSQVDDGNENGIRRSATSPAIKVFEVNEVKPNNTEKSVTRSNSFTLESPSKALIDHYRKQQLEQNPRKISSTKTKNTKPTPNVPKRVSSILSTSVTKDTVESRAKKVRKIEVKQNATAKARMIKAKQPTNTAPKQIKMKRSPYDAPSKSDVHNPKNVQKVVKKSISTKKSSSKTKTVAVPKINFNSGENALTTAANEVLGQIDASQREKFIKLLAEQALEQQRVQQAFELQQKTLLEEFTKNLNSTLSSSSPDLSESHVEQNYPQSISQTNSGCTTPSLSSTIFSNKCRKNNSSLNTSYQQLPPAMIYVDPMINNSPSNNTVTINNDGISSPKESLYSSSRHSPRRRFFFQTKNETSSPTSSGGATFRVQNTIFN